MQNVIIAALLALVPASAMAGGYWGLSAGYTLYEEEYQGLEEDVDLGMASVVGGYQFNDWIAIEGRAGTSNSRSVDVLGVDVDVKIDYYVSALAKVGYLKGAARPYVVVGATHGEITAGARGYEVNESDTAFSVGAGVELYGNDTTAVTFEYLYAMDGEVDGVDYKAQQLSLGFVHHF